MKLSEIKTHLGTAAAVNFTLPDGTSVPGHFHVTEVGMVTRHFIDCGGTIRDEKMASFQLWSSGDLEHRLQPQKLLNIIALSEKLLGLEDLEAEVEYQSGTIGRYGIEVSKGGFVLTNKHTDCLAKENCGVPENHEKLQSGGADAAKGCCTPGSDCC
jgi:uncharacterized protein DUF6428